MGSRGWGRPHLRRRADRSAAPACRGRSTVGLLMVAVLVLAGCSSLEATDTEGDAAPPAPAELEDRVPRDELVPGIAERERSATDPAAAAPERAAAPPPAPPPPPPASRDRVEAEAASLLNGLLERSDGERVVVLAVDEYGREIVSQDPDEPVLPASTLKIVTAAAALITFGPDARFTTRVEATAPIDRDGVVRGDLVLIGTGDPVLATPEYGRWIYPVRPRTPFEDLATQLAAAGITRVDGDVIGVVDRFDGPLTASGWPDRYFNDFDARFADGLSVDAGVRTIVTYPDDGSDDGSDHGSDDGSDDTGDGDGEGAQEEDDDPGEDDEATEPPVVRIEHTRNPSEHAVAELIRLLDEQDVEVAGQGRVGVPAGSSIGRLAVVSSPPLEEILRFAVQRSDNQVTDAIFRAVGRQRTGTGSFASGERALAQVLQGLGISTEGVVFADGSGLSRDDRVTARLLVDLDRAMHASRHAQTWTSLMAVMGESGTLQQRLSGSVAAGRFVGKTGTLRDVTGLTGAVLGDNGRRYHLAVIANADGQARWLSRTFADELIVLLSADVLGCDLLRVTDGDGDGALGRPPVVVRC